MKRFPVTLLLIFFDCSCWLRWRRAANFPSSQQCTVRYSGPVIVGVLRPYSRSSTKYVGSSDDEWEREKEDKVLPHKLVFFALSFPEYFLFLLFVKPQK